MVILIIHLFVRLPLSGYPYLVCIVYVCSLSLSLTYGLIYISCSLSYLQGVTAAKNDGFSLTSGDFPTLGSEKDNSGKNESQGYI